MEDMGWLPRPKVALTPTRGRLIGIALLVVAYVGLVLLRTHDITRTFWLFSDQILYWDTPRSWRSLSSRWSVRNSTSGGTRSDPLTAGLYG